MMEEKLEILERLHGKKGSAGGDNIASDTVKKETWVIEDDVIEKSKPIVLWKNFRK